MIKFPVWSLFAMALVLTACPPPIDRYHHDADIVRSHANALKENRFDSKRFRKEVAPLIRNHSKEYRETESYDAIEAFHVALDELVAAADASKNEDARRLIADLCYLLHEEYVSDKMESYRTGFPRPPGKDGWWEPESVEKAANTAPGNLEQVPTNDAENSSR